MIGETGAKRVINNNNIVEETVIDQCSTAVDNVQVRIVDSEVYSIVMPNPSCVF